MRSRFRWGIAATDLRSKIGSASTQSIPTVDMFMISPNYFNTMGIPLIAGEDFRNESPTAAKRAGAQTQSAPKLAIVNETFAHKLFDQENPIGRRVSGGGVTYRIVGVVKNIKSRTLGETESAILYRSLDQTAGTEASIMGYALIVRTPGDPAALTQSVREQVSALDPNMAVFNAETMPQHIHDALFLPRFAGTMFGIFGSVGLTLAAVGLFGVMSYSVSRRTREIGIRMALGSQVSAVQGADRPAGDAVYPGRRRVGIGGCAGCGEVSPLRCSMEFSPGTPLRLPWCLPFWPWWPLPLAGCRRGGRLRWTR